MNKKLWVIIAGGALAFLGALVYFSMGLRQHKAEVCITFNGRQSCRVAAGTTPEEAVRTASDNACALIASGVTETMACGRTKPDSIRFLE
ncbi:MAG TPA: hypothetical protein DEH78_27770 [Solibacterales bacterium]|nr:hypothetical protein [Bryobacterales bacterium]